MALREHPATREDTTGRLEAVNKVELAKPPKELPPLKTSDLLTDTAMLDWSASSSPSLSSPTIKWPQNPSLTPPRSATSSPTTPSSPFLVGDTIFPPASSSFSGSTSGWMGTVMGKTDPKYQKEWMGTVLRWTKPKPQSAPNDTVLGESDPKPQSVWLNTINGPTATGNRHAAVVGSPAGGI
jgi:hypothetical protein